jgi:N-methylhydantoinase B/oxoprolinase/acetone carboxylase alpha subunit
MIDGVIPIIGANGHREEELSDQEEAEFQALKAERIAAIQVKIAAVQARRVAFNAAKEAREAAEEKCRSRVDKLPEIQALLAEYQRVDLQNRKDEEAEDTISKGGMKSFVDMDGRRLSSWKPGNLSKIHTTQIVVVRCLQHSRLTI